jgi:hypothetical protein
MKKKMMKMKMKVKMKQMKQIRKLHRNKEKILMLQRKKLEKDTTISLLQNKIIQLEIL